MSVPAPRFKRLAIEELFGPGSHVIDIPLRLKERVTVLHGRNGSGKTITLGLIAALREGRYRELQQYPFKRLEIEMTSGESLVIEPVSENAEGRSGRTARMQPKAGHGDELGYTLVGPEGEREQGVLASVKKLSDGDMQKLGYIVSRFDFTEVGPDQYVSREKGGPYTQSELLSHFGPMLGLSPPKPSLTLRSAEGPALKAFRDSLPPVKFIQTDRLYRWDYRQERAATRDPMRRQLMVEHLSQQIRDLVQRADQQYRKTSTQRDASLAKRLFEAKPHVPARDELRARSEALREQEARLLSLGLLKESTSTVDESSLDDEQLRTFSIILSDREEKLKPFSEVVDKAERLLDSLNRKLAPKQVRLDVETGYQILTAAGVPLPLSRLSSGEQHELVLLHELLFEVTPGSLILIDEPELSLHVNWQEDMLPDLMEIAALSGLDFVLATHSPFIIGDKPGRADLMVRLGEPT